MSLYKLTFLILYLIPPALGAVGQKSATKTITTNELREHLSVIASDSMKGRSFEKISGQEMAAGYLRRKAEGIMLKPAGESYFQEFGIISSKPVGKNDSLFVLNETGDVKYETDLITAIRHFSGSPEAEGKLVFAGFGWKDNQKRYDDLEGVDLNGKIILCATGNPGQFEKNRSHLWEGLAERAKTDYLFERGANGVILITHPADRENTVFNRLKRRMQRTRYFPAQKPGNGKFVAVALPGVADAILGGKNKYKDYLNSIAKKMKPNTFEVGNTRIRTKIKRETEFISGKNVIGIVEGSDPVLKNECIVFVAHYDHLGINKHGEVYNGADDNGSGTAVLLELAEAFANSEIKPLRSMVFVWVTGEEVGLLGSEYYTQNPVFPLEKTVACINLDMVGRVYEPRDSIWKKSPKMVKDFDGLYTLVSDFSPHLKNATDSVCAELGLIPDHSLPDKFFHSSDHHHFHNNGVPILNLATGYHADYHKTTDDISKISFEKMKRVADLAFLVGLEIANKNY